MIMKDKKFYPWLVVALLWVVALLNYMDRQMLSTMREAMAMDIAELESATNFGRLMAIFLWIYGLVSPFAGAVADRISRKWLIIGSLCVWSSKLFWTSSTASRIRVESAPAFRGMEMPRRLRLLGSGVTNCLRAELGFDPAYEDIDLGQACLPSGFFAVEEKAHCAVLFL